MSSTKTTKGKSRPLGSKPSKKPSTGKRPTGKKGSKAVFSTSQVKTKPSTLPPKKKQKTYTDEELGIPKLNMITPAGVQKPKGKKRGKVFTDDPESMMTILAMVQAEKEGAIESKMMKARQMEEIRAARAEEAVAKKEGKKAKLEEKKESLRKHKKRKSDARDEKPAAEEGAPKPTEKRKKKRVSFG